MESSLVKNRGFPEKQCVIMLGTFDTKSEDFEYLHTCLTEKGLDVVTLNVGIFESATSFPINLTSKEVAQLGGSSLNELRELNDRSVALEIMSNGATIFATGLCEQDKVCGIVSMGGGGGTYIALKVMRNLPFGIPKLCISTLATKDLSAQIGFKDITLMPSVVDVSGLNSISRVVIRQAAGALSGMILEQKYLNEKSRNSIAISVFGNTTRCVDKCTETLKSKGFDVLAFHAVGTGGQTMEALIRDGYFDAILDITTTELADELCGGICSAGSDRLSAASDMGIPQVVAPGCMDMVNFGTMKSVPEKYKARQLYSWAPDVTLMRTNEEENRILGRMLAEKLNKSPAPVTILLPLRGLSKIGGVGNVFYNPTIDQELFSAIKTNVTKNVKVLEIDANIDTTEFAFQATDALLEIFKS